MLRQLSFVGKQVGVLGMCTLARVLGLAAPPQGMRISHLYGASLLCGIGFTMSLFIGSLAFVAAPHQAEASVLGVLCASVVSAVIGYLWLLAVLPAKRDGDAPVQA